ncbi:hypothetical protein MMC16_000022 [Acarospora aff. strigata]|nr:hypothetical protein [Acarospora aff. strigata]
MYRSRSDLADFAFESPHYHHSSKVIVVLGSDKYQLRLSTIQHHLPGLFRNLRRNLKNGSRSRKRQIDLVQIVLSSNIARSRDLTPSDAISCAQTILEHVSQYDTDVIGSALSQRLDTYLRDRGTVGGPLPDWKRLAKVYATMGKLLDPNLLGCGPELFGAFAGWFIDEAPMLVRALPLLSLLDFVHAWEHTHHPIEIPLSTMVANLDPQTTKDLIYLGNGPSYLGSYIYSRTVHRIKAMVYENLGAPTTRDRHHSPALDSNILMRPALLPRHPSGGGRRDLTPRAHETAVVSGDELCREKLHDIVDFEPERILVKKSRARPHHRAGRYLAFNNDDDDDFPADPAWESDYDAHDIGATTGLPCLSSPYDDLRNSAAHLHGLYDTALHGAHGIPVMA